MYAWYVHVDNHGKVATRDCSCCIAVDLFLDLVRIWTDKLVHSFREGTFLIYPKYLPSAIDPNIIDFGFNSLPVFFFSFGVGGGGGYL